MARDHREWRKILLAAKVNNEILRVRKKRRRRRRRRMT
jgi:hypothetical protein